MQNGEMTKNNNPAIKREINASGEHNSNNNNRKKKHLLQK